MSSYEMRCAAAILDFKKTTCQIKSGARFGIFAPNDVILASLQSQIAFSCHGARRSSQILMQNCSNVQVFSTATQIGLEIRILRPKIHVETKFRLKQREFPKKHYLEPMVLDRLMCAKWHKNWLKEHLLPSFCPI